MSLGDFLSEGPSNMSWADEELALPSAPMATSAAPTRTSVLDAPDRKDLPTSRREYDMPQREPRGPVEFPTEPPFTAYVGNLSYTADEAMLRQFFAGVQSVRLVRDRETERPKGFGYVQFETLDSLKEAVAKDGSEMGGRQLRVNVSEARPTQGGSAHEDRTGGATNWRRADALPVETTSPFESRSSSGFGRSASGFGRTASSGREPREAREPREPLPPSVAEKVSDWRVHKEPVVVAEAQSPPQTAALPPKRSGFSDRFSRSSSGAGPDSGDEPKVWRRERRDSDSATPPAVERQASAPRREPREPREYQAPRDRSASREPTRAPRQPTVAEQANTWRAARAPPAPAAEKPVEAEAEVAEPEVAEPEVAEPEAPVAKPEVAEPVAPAAEPVAEPAAVDEEGWSQVEKPTAPRRTANVPATGRGGGRNFDRNRSGSGRHREANPEANGEGEKRSPRPSERRTGGGFFAARDATATESGSWRR
ncbi:Eukaryotic translation initiation factor 4B [Coemansia aciculifera]|nr:Eukaryotic translation initiation factor 4B [Coemansia aciculifera]